MDKRVTGSSDLSTRLPFKGQKEQINEEKAKEDEGDEDEENTLEKDYNLMTIRESNGLQKKDGTNHLKVISPMD